MILGIDIGTQGALALLTYDGKLVEVVDMPVLKDGPKGRPRVNAPLLWDILVRWRITKAFVEQAGPRPGEGAVGACSFCRSSGIIEMGLAALCVPCTFITPASWKRALGLSKASKDASRSEAIRRYPARSELFKRKCDDGRAEAVLIAIAGMQRKDKLK